MYDPGELEYEAPLLQDLMRSSGWKVFMKYAAQNLEALTERVLTSPSSDFDYNKGVYWGAKDTLNIPETVIQLAARQKE